MNILQMGGDMANEQEESGIDGEGEFWLKIQIHQPSLPPAEMTNLVTVVDNVAKDIDLQQRLTSSVNQLVTWGNSLQSMQFDLKIYNF